MLQKAFIILISLNLLHEVSMIIVNEYAATTSFQYIHKSPSMYNGDYIWRLTPNSTYREALHYMEIHWITFAVEGKMPTCDPDFVEVFVLDKGPPEYKTHKFRSIGKYCSNTSSTDNATDYMYSGNPRMLIRYRSTRGSTLYLRYRLRSRQNSFIGSYSSTSCISILPNSTSGNIYSNGYPRSYVGSTSTPCFYTITPLDGKETRIAAMDINMNCNNRVEVRGSSTPTTIPFTSGILIGRFSCDNALTLVTRYPYIYIRFLRYTSDTRRGFMLSYIVYDKSTATSTQSDVCTFELDECGFNQSKSDHINWYRVRGVTTSHYTGPSVDHSPGTSKGYYMYVETSNPTVHGDKAILSKQYSNITTEGSCLTFWYHMHGPTIGQLNVYLKNISTDPLMSPEWSLTGEQGDRWEMGQVTMTKDRSIVVFEGKVGTTYYGDIAIDDIMLKAGKCSRPATDNGAPFAIQHRNGKLCLSWNKINDDVVFTYSCNELFSFTKDGSLLHLQSGKCLAPTPTTFNIVLKLQAGCDSMNTWFYNTSLGAIRHLRTGRCLHTIHGSSTPMPGTSLIMENGCEGASWEFHYIPGGITTTMKPSTTTDRPSTTTDRPSTTTNRPSTTTNRPSTTTNRPSTTTNRPSTTTDRPSTTTNRPSTTTNRPSTTSKKPAGDSDGQEKSDGRSTTGLTAAVIVLVLIIVIILVIIAIYFINQRKKERESDREDKVMTNLHYINNSTGNDDKGGSVKGDSTTVVFK